MGEISGKQTAQLRADEHDLSRADAELQRRRAEAWQAPPHIADGDEITRLALNIAEAVMGNTTIEAVFGSDNPEADGFKADIQIEAARVLRSAATPSAPLPAGTVTEEMVATVAKAIVFELSEQDGQTFGLDADLKIAYLDQGEVDFGLVARAAIGAAFAARPAEPVAVRGLAEGAIPAWPPLKKALWDVVTGETLNDGHYINAYDLTNKLCSAAALVPTLAPGLVEALTAAKDFIALEYADSGQEQYGEWLAPEARRVFGLICEALASITETGGAK